MGHPCYRIVSDHLGSVRLVVNVLTGEITQRLSYDERGRVTENTNANFQPFAYAGGMYDDQTKRVRFGARDYDPRIGRWMAKDPLGLMVGKGNLYEYANGDPINFVDPTGLEPLSDCVANFLKGFQQDLYPDVDFSKVDLHFGELPGYTKLAPIDVAGITRGYDIYFAPNTINLGSADGIAFLMHELLHTQSYAKQGYKTFTAKYLGESLWQMLQLNHPYDANKYEVEAKALQRAMGDYLRKAYGHTGNGPCPGECAR